jgi:DNA ligase-1
MTDQIRLNKTFQIFEDIKNTSGRKAKIALLGSVPKALLQQIVNWTYNPYINYWVRVDKINRHTSYADGDTEKMWLAFETLLTQLSTRKLTGNAAVNAVDEFLTYDTDAVNQKWFAAIINRDLKIGIGPDTFIKEFFPGLFPVMHAQLCETWEGEALPAAWIAQPKLDGLRCVIIRNWKGEFTALSRNNKPLSNMDGIFKALASVSDHSYVLDGELFTDDWNKSISIAMTDGVHSDAHKLRFHAFDMLPLWEWESRRCTYRLRQRLEMLGKFCAQVKSNSGGNRVTLIPSVIASGPSGIRSLMEQHLQQGFEGSVLKDPDSMYAFKRSKTWLKVKPVYEADLCVTGFAEGKGKYVGGLGALLVGGPLKHQGASYQIETEVGSGFNDEQRADLWRQRSTLIGCTVQIEHQGIAERMNDKGTVRALKFPVFVRMRPDKD